tara:strand:- start:157 stop:375 length:219 start_codon:yes stop_codon:yes gene_type:complete
MSKEENIMTALKAFADRHVERFISRKFLAWLTATVLAVTGAVTSGDWVAVTLAYIGSQALVDLAVQWKHGKH